MRQTCCLLALGLAACQGEATGLSLPSDAGSTVDAGRDAGSAADAGQDAGVGDAGASCTSGERFDLSVQTNASAALEGPAEVLGYDPLRLRVAGQEVEIGFFGRAPSLDGLSPRDQIHARIELYRPFWTEARVTLSELGPAGPGDLLLLAWSGSSYGEERSTLPSYHYEDGDCILDLEGCGTTRSQTLVLSFSGRQERLPISDARDLGELRAFNGRSVRYLEPPQCTDTPMAWYAGWVTALGPAPHRCDLVARDDCLALSHCTLWGSELYDPGYACVPARTRCERVLDHEACNQDPGCAWDPGACYCPEGLDCACAGGPAPKCRTLCGGPEGGVCGDGQYCDVPRIAPICIDPPAQGGQCERVPGDCAGTPPGSVCACPEDPDGPAETFTDDCRRRQARASGGIEGACE